MGAMMGSMTAWSLAWIVLGVLVVAGAFAAGAAWARHAATPRREFPPSPADVLKHRYAAGEIDEDDYLIRLSGLT